MTPKSRRSFLKTLAAAGGAGAVALSLGRDGLLPGAAAEEDAGGHAVSGRRVHLAPTDDPFHNGQRLYRAWERVLDAGGGQILLDPGEYRIPQPLACVDRRDSLNQEPIALLGQGSHRRGVLIKAGWTSMKEAFIDLSGSSHVQLKNVFLDGAYANEVVTRYGIVMRRTNADSAGRHVLEHCTLANFKRTGLYSHGSEFMQVDGCSFGRTPIGAILSAYPLKGSLTDADFETPGTDLIRWGDTPVSNGGGVFNACTFGDQQLTTRASVMLAQQSPTRHTSCIYQTAPGGEAKLLIDECWAGHFVSPWSDSHGAKTVFKVGKYSPNYGERNNKYTNRLDIIDGKIDATSDAVVVDGSNMVGTTIRNLWVNRPEPPIKLDRTCRWTTIENATNGIAVAGKVPIHDEGIETACKWGAQRHGFLAGSSFPTAKQFSPGEWGLYRDQSTGRLYVVANDAGKIKRAELV